MLDHAKIDVRGGDGGAGSASFRREKHVPKGGPDGGDGGKGGDVHLQATRQIRDLSPFRQKVHVRAGDGGHGRGGNKRGRDGDDAVVEVPVGTEVRIDGALIADLVVEGQRALVATGGEGGRGNTCFVSSTRRAPRFAEKGLPGEERWIELTLKLLADVGFVGLPNAGKSSLLAALTRARPKIAPYPFTTLEPNLGTVIIDERQIVLADIPGLVEGASAGVGLGDRFLAHVERTAVLLYVVDVSPGADAACAAARTVRDELTAFSPALLTRPALCALNKVDLVGAGEASAAVASLRSAGLDWAAPPLATSAVTGSGVEELVVALGLAPRRGPRERLHRCARGRGLPHRRRGARTPGRQDGALQRRGGALPAGGHGASRGERGPAPRRGSARRRRHHRRARVRVCVSADRAEGATGAT
jgi:GTP-binding protein